MPLSALQSMGIEETLEHVNVPSYLIDTSGIIRWVNPAAGRLVGDVRGRQFTSVVAPEETRRAREMFARKVVGAVKVTDAGIVLLDKDGGRVAVEVKLGPCAPGRARRRRFRPGLGRDRRASPASGSEPHATAGGGARSARTRAFDGADRRGASAEHGNGSQSHPTPASRHRRQLAVGSGRDRTRRTLISRPRRRSEIPGRCRYLVNGVVAAIDAGRQAARTGVVGTVVGAVAFFDGVFIGAPIALLAATLRPSSSTPSPQGP